MGDREIEAAIAEKNLDTIILAFPDHNARLMGKRLTADHFLDLGPEAEIHACNYLLAADLDLNPLPGFKLAGWEQGYGDHVMKPDKDTFRILPWYKGTGLLLCDLLDHDGTPVEESPRRILKKTLDSLGRKGLEVKAASELEFYLFDESPERLSASGHFGLSPTTPYRIDYYVLGTDRDEDLLRAIRNQMAEAGIPVEGSKGEWDRGQHEVNLSACNALDMADRHVVFKEGVKALARGFGKAVTFMAKVDENLAGSSCHIHLSLYDGDGRNVFWDEKAGEPTAFFDSFLAGCIRYTRELCIFLAPNVNSYKRYRAQSFAPVTLAWGRDNRTCGFRVVGREQSFRVECRIPGADVNPYLAYSAILAAGITGVEQRLQPVPEFEGDAYAADDVERVPTSLADALSLFQGSQVAEQAFGQAVKDHYARLAALELDESRRIVSDWERKRYFERV